MNIFKHLIIIISILIIAGFSSASISAQDTCYADFDLNDDGYAPSIADLVILMRMMNGDTTFSDNMYVVDLNGDCVIDDGDIEMLNCFLIYGIVPCFPEWPVPTCCDPLLTVGACCLPDDSCTIRSEENCLGIGGGYMGDGTYCDDEEACCCKGMRGNADCSPDDLPNVTDLVWMVKRVFIGDFSCCEMEEDVDGNGEFNITDLVYMVNYVFKGGPAPLPCY